MKKYKLTKYASLVFQSCGTYSHWVGYYTICPLNKANDKLILHRSKFDGRNVCKEDCVEVGWINIDDNEPIFHSIDDTNAFNWQQGANLQWLHQDGKEIIVYNKFHKGMFFARIFDFRSLEKKDVCFPIYICDGETALSLDYERLFWCRAYHYYQIENVEKNVNVLANDGIYQVDLSRNTKKMILPIEKIIKIDPDDDFVDLKHWIEHLVYSRSRKKVAFFHRFYLKNGTYKTRVFSMNADGSGLKIISGWRDCYYTHLNWLNDNTIVCFTVLDGVVKNKIMHKNNDVQKSNVRKKIFNLCLSFYRNKIAKKIPQIIRDKYFNHNRYVVYDIEKGKIGELNNYHLYVDGHPSFTKDERFMLTDTYADSKGYRNLLIYDILKNKVFHLGRFFSPFNDCSYRSDLHPRFSCDEKMVVIDSAHSGKHQCVVLKIDWSIIRG